MRVQTNELVKQKETNGNTKRHLQMVPAKQTLLEPIDGWCFTWLGASILPHCIQGTLPGQHHRHLQKADQSGVALCPSNLRGKNIPRSEVRSGNMM